MKAYQVVENGKPLEEREVEKPKPTGKEILLKTVACGVCHSDVHIHEGYFSLGDEAKLPVPLMTDALAMGHEIFGEVVELGDQVKDIEIGKKYVAYPWIGCGDCNECKNEREHYCSPLTTKNLGINVDGGYAEYVLVPDSKYLFDAGDTPDEVAGSYACRGLTAYSALKKADLKKGQKSVVIISAGGLGLLSLKIIQAAYSINPIVVDIDDDKLDLAKKAGASAVINSKDEKIYEKIAELTEGGATSVIDFVGAAETFELASGMFGMKRGGTYVIVGLIGGETNLQLPMTTLTARTIRGIYVGSLAEMGELMQLVKEGKIEHVDVEKRNASTANETLNDLKNGKINGLVCLTHDHK
jgi:alcohol dehydrogenase/propanol-preferring alcohol dehydrogenase|tara:strand:- start:1913 stop:2980 length:1068 start_codon:yes stop_codon:yes gene_type:complete